MICCLPDLITCCFVILGTMFPLILFLIRRPTLITFLITARLISKISNPVGLYHESAHVKIFISSFVSYACVINSLRIKNRRNSLKAPFSSLKIHTFLPREFNLKLKLVCFESEKTNI